MRPCLLLLLLLVAQHSLAKAVSGSEVIEIGGIKQWIKYKGPDEGAPVLLMLHGGPGNSMAGYADKFTSQLKQNFIVVLWDQRESGETLALNKSAEPLTVDLFIRDAIQVIDFLRNKFSQEKIYLLGHSWGGYLGLRVAAARPDLLKGYFAMSPMINQLESERLALKAMQEKARNENNTTELDELSKVEIPFQNGLQLYYHRKWLSKLQGSRTPAQQMVETWAQTWLPLFNEASNTDFNTFAPEIKCPVYFLIGKRDYQTYFILAEMYYNQLVCPEKKLYWFEHSAHSPNTTEPEKFQNILIEISKQH